MPLTVGSNNKIWTTIDMENMLVALALDCQFMSRISDIKPVDGECLVFVIQKDSPNIAKEDIDASPYVRNVDTPDKKLRVAHRVMPQPKLSVVLK